MNPRTATAGALAATLALLGSIVRLSGSFPGDERVLEALYERFGTDLDDVMTFVGAATDTAPIIGAWVVAVVVLVRLGRRPDAVSFVLLVAGAMIGNRVLKEVVRRGRPEVRVSPEELSTFAFPSGHATNALVLAVGVLLVWSGRRRAAVGVVGAAAFALVAFSRLAIAVHYPTDIVASVLWVALLATLLWPRFRPRSPSAGSRSASHGGPPGGTGRAST